MQPLGRQRFIEMQAQGGNVSFVADVHQFDREIAHRNGLARDGLPVRRECEPLEVGAELYPGFVPEYDRMIVLDLWSGFHARRKQEHGGDVAEAGQEFQPIAEQSISDGVSVFSEISVWPFDRGDEQAATMVFSLFCASSSQ